jgi:hypothetical protein
MMCTHRRFDVNAATPLIHHNVALMTGLYRIFWKIKCLFTVALKSVDITEVSYIKHIKYLKMNIRLIMQSTIQLLSVKVELWKMCKPISYKSQAMGFLSRYRKNYYVLLQHRYNDKSNHLA